MSSPTTAVPGYVAGTWKISPDNSEVRFTVRHLGVSNVHGRFKNVSGVIVTSDAPQRSSVRATISAASVDTGFPARDGYLRGDGVLAADDHSRLRYASKRIRTTDSSLLVDGELTIRRITRPVTIAVTVGGFAEDPVGSVQVLGLTGTTTLHRRDFELAATVPPLIVGEDITVELDIYAIRER